MSWVYDASVECIIARSHLHVEIAFDILSTRNLSDLRGFDKAYEVDQFPLSWEAAEYFESNLWNTDRIQTRQNGSLWGAAVILNKYFSISYQE